MSYAGEFSDAVSYVAEPVYRELAAYYDKPADLIHTMRYCIKASNLLVDKLGEVGILAEPVLRISDAIITADSPHSHHLGTGVIGFSHKYCINTHNPDEIADLTWQQYLLPSQANDAQIPPKFLVGSRHDIVTSAQHYGVRLAAILRLWEA